MAKAVWTGSISFGLVQVPVRVVAATRAHTLRFRQLHAEDLSPIRYRKVCESEGRPLDAEEIVRGYEVDPGQFVVVTDEELDALKPRTSETIELMGFVNLSEIEPIYQGDTYYLVPDSQSPTPYRLLLEALRDTNRAGVGKFIMHNKEYLVAVYPRGDALTLMTLRYADEIHEPGAVEGIPHGVHAAPEDLRIARQLVDAAAMHFHPEDFRDEFTERLERMIRGKAEGREIPAPEPEPVPPEVVDLREALRQSLAEAQRQREEEEQRRKSA